MSIAFIYRTDVGLVKRQVTTQHIGEAERVLEVRLPQDFADFLMAHDGPTPIPGWYPAQTPHGIVWHGPIVTLTSTAGPRMGRLGPRNDCIEGNTQMRRDQERLPKHFLAIGMMFTQPRMLLLSTADNERGAVYVWHIGDKRFKQEQTVRIAASFSEFIGLLTDPPPEVATVFRRVLADTLAEASADCGDPFPHLRCAQALRNIRDEDDMGPYADSLVVQLPTDPEARAAVCRRCEREMDEPTTLDPKDTAPLTLWWD
jgi:hypothetical protein